MADDSGLLSLIADLHAVVTVEEFRWELLRALRRAIPVDWISLNDIGPGPNDAIVITMPEPPAELWEPFGRYVQQNPLIAHYLRTRNGRALRFSDLITVEDYHALDVYREVYEPLGIEHQMSTTLPHSDGRILGIALSRCERDFSDAERDLLEGARPFIIQSYRNAIAYSDRPIVEVGPPLPPLLELGLTRRQAEVVRLIATGMSELEIASTLGISVRTVHKHLERAYRALGVGNRSEAAAAAWAAAAGGI